MRLQNKVAIVTGAGRGLGKAIAFRLAEEGAIVVAADVDLNSCSNNAKEIQAKKLNAFPFRVDITEEKDTINLANETAARFGAIDILVNNAALYYGISWKPFEQISLQEWDKVMAVNVRGCWQCIKAVSPYMKKVNKGKIVNVASSVFFTPPGVFCHYIASKGAVIALTRALAIELGQYNITVNAIAPGVTMTEATKMAMTEEEALKTIQRRPIKRLEQPEDIVGVVVFLSSDDSNFMTGQTMIVDGGRAF